MVSRPIGTGKYYQRNSHHNTGLTVSFRGTVASEDLWNVYSNGEVFFSRQLVRHQWNIAFVS